MRCVVAAYVAFFSVVSAACEAVRMGDDSVVRVTSSSGYAECARIAFELPVKPEWKALVRTGEGLNAQNAWAVVGAGITVPWYVLLHDGAKTYGFGVKVQPRAMCSWRVGKGKVELLLDLRAAGRPLELGGRTLEACEVVRCESAPGDDMVILGCNAVNHLCAGLFEASRVGPDTSGKNWEQTKRNGVGAVAFKGIENGTLFAADPDCAGLASEGAIPWEKNRQWIDLLSRSGMPFFISWRRTLASGEVRKALSAAFSRAARCNRTAEAIDWLETSVPHRWLTADGIREYTWE